MNNKLKTFIVIPAYNEESSLGKVIKRLKRRGYNNIIVVNDGSKDQTLETAKKENVLVYNLIINSGLGVALKTGIKAAVLNGADIIVTFDADGQHHINDIKKIVKPISEGESDVVIGSRLLNRKKNMPFMRRIGNSGLNFVTFLLFGIWVTDSQSGLRGFSRKAAQKIEINSDRMEVSSEIIKEIKEKELRFKEVPIKTIYTEYSLEHGQNSIFGGFKIMYKLIIIKIFGK